MNSPMLTLIVFLNISPIHQIQAVSILGKKRQARLIDTTPHKMWNTSLIEPSCFIYYYWVISRLNLWVLFEQCWLGKCVLSRVFCKLSQGAPCVHRAVCSRRPCKVRAQISRSRGMLWPNHRELCGAIHSLRARLMCAPRTSPRVRGYPDPGIFQNVPTFYQKHSISQEKTCFG